MTSDAELWRPTPGFPGYKASDRGRIGSCLKCMGRGKGHAITDGITRVLRPRVNKRGYAYVTPRQGGRTRTMLVATLVMLAFHGPRPEGLEVCHGDNDPSNNCLSNLRYDTHSANMREAIGVGRPRRLTLKQAEAICAEYAAGGISHEAIAQKRGVSRRTISHIIHGSRYQEARRPAGQ